MQQVHGLWLVHLLLFEANLYISGVKMFPALYCWIYLKTIAGFDIL